VFPVFDSIEVPPHIDFVPDFLVELLRLFKLKVLALLRVLALHVTPIEPKIVIFSFPERLEIPCQRVHK